jgi:hypothetical protein
MNTFNFYDVIAIIGVFVQIFGLILFGVTSGWFTLYVINQPEKNWQLQGIVYGVFFVFISLMVKHLTPGAFGAYLTGTASALIYWGLIKNREKPVKKK